MRIRIFDTPIEAGVYAAALTEQVILQKENPVLGCATGSTPIPFYDALINMHSNGLDLSSVSTINLDEYVGLPSDHKQSYSYFMKSHFFSYVNMKPENIHIPDGAADNLEEECERYDDIIRKHPIDIQILGVGSNGHIGFNEPSSLLMTKTHLVQLMPETIKSNARFFDQIEAVPKMAITMGIQSILQARKIILMAFGSEKAAIVAATLQNGVRTDVPASILQLHSDVTVILDRESSAQIII